MKNVTIENDNDALVAFAQTIDFAGLFNHIRAFLKVDCGFYQPEIIASRKGVYVTFVSDDITNLTGPFAAILDRCYIYESNNKVFKEKITGEIGYWVIVGIRYEHKEGGSNGMNVVRAGYQSGKWEFYNAGERE
jgi:hypothetical protein